jgi:hypothetical protein
MPQENYTLQGFNWDGSLDNLRKSSLIVGDLGDEEIARTRGVVCAHIKVKNEKVSFNLSPYGKLQISNPNADLMRRAKSQLNKLIACSRWVPSGEEKDSKKGRIDYQSIMDLPEAKEADWSKIPKNEILKLNQWFLAVKDYHYDFLLDSIRTTLASYTKSSDDVKAKETKSLKDKAKEWFNANTKNDQ